MNLNLNVLINELISNHFRQQIVGDVAKEYGLFNPPVVYKVSKNYLFIMFFKILNSTLHIYNTIILKIMLLVIF